MAWPSLIVAYIFVSILTSLVHSSDQVGCEGIWTEGQERAWFGDPHVHTAYSLDSYLFGNRSTPADAYAFARGEALRLPGGGEVRLSRPLDFAVITDHAEGYGERVVCTDAAYAHFTSNACEAIRQNNFGVFEKLQVSTAVGSSRALGVCIDSLEPCRLGAQRAWHDAVTAAHEANQPGTFTSFVGYEYSPAVGNTGHLHRNVVFKDTAPLESPISSYEASTVADLWRKLSEVCEAPCDVVTIPHNTNYSWGVAFGQSKRDGTSFSVEELALRSHLEPVVEIFQAKGNSECNPLTGTDEGCWFEQIFRPCAAGQLEECIVPGSFVRDGLHLGLQWHVELGFNPVALGFVGATDTHNATPGNVDHQHFAGNLGFLDDAGVKRLAAENLLRFNPGGLTGIWATTNDRASLFDGLRRRRTFATSGPRIAIDMVASWTSHRAARPAARMGGFLGPFPGPDFVPQIRVRVDADRRGGPIEAVQVIKGWRIERSSLEIVSDAKRITECDGSVVFEWVDTGFDPGVAAFYYARAMEGPSLRWQVSDMRAENGVGGKLQSLPSDTTRHRAWSSPVWYQPARSSPQSAPPQ